MSKVSSCAMAEDNERDECGGQVVCEQKERILAEERKNTSSLGVMNGDPR